MHRAYSLLQLKSVDDDARVIEGTASTPEVDRMGDMVVPEGAVFTLPIPLLWQHRSDQPIGHVTRAKVTKKGIEIRAEIAKGIGIARIDEAWALMKSGLVRGLSIGFKALEEAQIDGTFGLKFLKWEWLELSAVTIPANSSASIALIKSLDVPDPAESGTADPIITARLTTSRVLDTVRAVPVRQATRMATTIAERIKTWQDTLAAKNAELNAVQDKAQAEGRAKDETERETFEGLKSEIHSITKELEDLRDMEKINTASAKAVEGQTPAQAAVSRDVVKTAHVSVEGRMPDGLEFGAMVLCKAQSYLELQKGNFVSPVDIAKRRYPDYPRIQNYLLHKTNVAAGTTTDANWAAALLPAAQTLESEFLAWLRPQTIIDRFGTVQNGVRIPSLKRVPFNVKVQSQTSGASASWVGEGKGKPVTKFNTTSATLLFTKIAAISVITEELARFSRPGAEGLVRDELSRAVVERMDTDFIDPAKAVSSGLNPASITNGLTALSSAGTSAANVLTDVQALIAPFLRANYNVTDLVLLMPNTLALTLSLMQNSLGQESFKGMTVSGGSLAGIPVLASNYLASGASYGNMVVALSAENIALADDGNVSVDASREASIEMSDAPANESATPTMSAYMVSMFQSNSVAIRAEREINWKKLRSDAVVYMDDVNWGSIGSPV